MSTVPLDVVHLLALFLDQISSACIENNNLLIQRMTTEHTVTPEIIGTLQENGQNFCFLK